MLARSTRAQRDGTEEPCNGDPLKLPRWAPTWVLSGRFSHEACLGRTRSRAYAAGASPGLWWSTAACSRRSSNHRTHTAFVPVRHGAAESATRARRSRVSRTRRRSRTSPSAQPAPAGGADGPTPAHQPRKRPRDSWSGCCIRYASHPPTLRSPKSLCGTIVAGSMPCSSRWRASATVAARVSAKAVAQSLEALPYVGPVGVIRVLDEGLAQCHTQAPLPPAFDADPVRHGFAVSRRVGPAVHAPVELLARGLKFVRELGDGLAAGAPLGHRPAHESDKALGDPHATTIPPRRRGNRKPDREPRHHPCTARRALRTDALQRCCVTAHVSPSGNRQTLDVVRATVHEPDRFTGPSSTTGRFERGNDEWRPMGLVGPTVAPARGLATAAGPGRGPRIHTAGQEPRRAPRWVRLLRRPAIELQRVPQEVGVRRGERPRGFGIGSERVESVRRTRHFDAFDA